MDLEFIKIGQSFAVGIIFVCLLIWLDTTAKLNIKRNFIEKKFSGTDPSLNTIIFLSIVFSIGVSFNTASDHMVSGPGKFDYLRELLPQCLNIEYKDDIKASTLIKFDIKAHREKVKKAEAEKCKFECTQKQASAEAAKTSAATYLNLSTEITSICEDIENLKGKGNATNVCKKGEVRQRDIKSFFYRAKNFDYSIKNYYDELDRINDRVEFARSLYFVFLLSLVFFACTLIKHAINCAIKSKINFLINICQHEKNKIPPSKESILIATNTTIDIHNTKGAHTHKHSETKVVTLDEDSESINPCSFIGHMLIFFLVVLVCLWACKEIYEHESKDYYKRVFGYYISWIEDKEMHDTDISITAKGPLMAIKEVSEASGASALTPPKK